jgi:hypothetical protein
MAYQHKPVDENSSKPVFTKLTPAMTKEQKALNLRRALEKSGFTIHPSLKPNGKGGAS